MDRVQEIKSLHDAVIGAVKQSLENAIRIGQLLTEQKAEGGYGNWGEWVAENLPFSKATADNYRRLFRERDQLTLLNVSKLADAYRLLYGKPQPERKRLPPDREKPEAEPYPLSNEYEELIGYLGEKVFHSPDWESTALYCARFVRNFIKRYERKELNDEQSLEKRFYIQLARHEPRQIFDDEALRLFDPGE